MDRKEPEQVRQGESMKLALGCHSSYFTKPWIGLVVEVKDAEEEEAIIQKVLHSEAPAPFQFDRYASWYLDRTGVGHSAAEAHLTFRCTQEHKGAFQAWLRHLGVKVKKEYTWDEHPGTILNAYMGTQLALDILGFFGSAPNTNQLLEIIHFMMDGLGKAGPAETRLQRLLAATV